MDKKNYYKTLGVTETATDEEIKKAYKKKAFEEHPDRNQQDPGAEARFKQVQEAYSILSNPQKRSLYDTGADENQPQGFPEDFEGEIWKMMQNSFGGWGARMKRNAQTAYDAGVVEITLLDVLNGKTEDREVSLTIPCKDCVGQKVDTRKSKGDCETCKGKGIKTSQIFGNFGSMSTTCKTCNGLGKQYEPCLTCSASGVTQIKEKINIKIPPGATEGTLQIKLPKYNNILANISIQLKVSEDLKLDEEGNVYKTINLPFSSFILGDSYTLKLIEQTEATVKIPAGIGVGKGIKVKGKGIPKVINAKDRGDFILITNLEIPKNLTEQQKNLIAKLKEQGL